MDMYKDQIGDEVLVKIIVQPNGLMLCIAATNMSHDEYIYQPADKYLQIKAELEKN